MRTIGREGRVAGGWRLLRPGVGRVMLLVLVGGLASCSTLGMDGDALPGGDPFEPWDAEAPVVILDIQNQSNRQARIYARWNGIRNRVGEARAMQDTQLEVEYREGSLRVEVDFVGADGFVSQPYSVRPGQVIRFRIPR